MPPLTPAFLSALIAVVLFAAPAGAEEWVWHDALSFTLEGKGWADTSGPYVRLPDSARGKVNDTAWAQSRQSAGLCVRFITDAAKVRVRWSVGGGLSMPHMPATGVSGVDLYTRREDSTWWFVGNGRPHKAKGNESDFEFPGGGREGRECMLYLPLYNLTESVEVAVPEGSEVAPGAPRPEDKRQPVLIYGTSITQGGCASRPGMAWTSILGRLLDRPVINLGFSASGTMEPPVGEVLAELDPAVYVIDCIWNMGDSEEVYLERITQLVHTLRETHADTPILFVAQSFIQPDAHPTELSGRQSAAVHALQKEGVQGLTLIPGDDLIGHDGEGTVDGVHLNDLGMDRQARCLLPYVRQALAGPDAKEAGAR